MPQIDQRRQEILEEQRQADTTNVRIQRDVLAYNSLRQEKIALQRQADTDDEESDNDDEESPEEERKNFLLRALKLREQHVKIAEADLNEEVRTKPTLLGYSFPLFAAVLKDLLDLVGFSLPLISFVVTAMFSIVIFIGLYLAKTNRSLFEMRRIAIFIVGFLVEAFGFGLNLFPLEVVTVLLIFLLDKVASSEKIAKALEIVDNIKGVKKIPR